MELSSNMVFSPDLQVQLDDAKARVTLRLSGDVNLREMDAFFTEAEPLMRQWLSRLGTQEFETLVDLSEATLRFKLNDVQHMVFQNESFTREEKREALVAPSDLLYGLGRIYQALQPSRDIQVFRSLEDAENWLNESYISA